ncbi:hypothetical protein ACEPPN_000872 [Leptodophora sp. 'Broadleaf-Isolate-01']
MLPYAFLLMFLFVGSSMANAAAGKWQLLFFYQVYQYQAAALGVTNSLMAIGCSDPPAVCNLKDFIKYTTTRTRTLPVKDPTTKKPLKDSAGKPLTYISNNWAVVDWDAIGDGDTFDEDKFSSEMDKANFKGGMENAKIFKTEPQKSFSGVMGEAEKIFVAAAAKLTANGLPKSNSFSAEVISALDIHADARRADQAILIVENFKNWAKDNGVKEVLGEEIERTGVPTYQLLDAQKTIDQNKLTGDRAALVINFVKKFNAAGQSPSHVTAISTASTLKTKIAKACSGK